MADIRFDVEYTRSSQEIVTLRDVRRKCTDYNLFCMYYRAGIINQEIECEKCHRNMVVRISIIIQMFLCFIVENVEVEYQ